MHRKRANDGSGWAKAVRRLRRQTLTVFPLFTLAMSWNGAAGQGTGLFLPLETRDGLTAAAAARPDPLVIRHRMAAIDFSALAGTVTALKRGDVPHPTLRLILFENAEFTAIVEETHPTSSGYALLGRIEDVDLATMALVVNGDVVAGTVRTPQATYRIRTAGKRAYSLDQLDPSKMRPGAMPATRPPPARRVPIPRRYDRSR